MNRKKPNDILMGLLYVAAAIYAINHYAERAKGAEEIPAPKAEVTLAPPVLVTVTQKVERDPRNAHENRPQFGWLTYDVAVSYAPGTDPKEVAAAWKSAERFKGIWRLAPPPRLIPKHHKPKEPEKTIKIDIKDGSKPHYGVVTIRDADGDVVFEKEIKVSQPKPPKVEEGELDATRRVGAPVPESVATDG